MRAAAIKIGNEPVDAALTIDLDRIISQEIIPEMPLLPRHIFPQLPGAVFQFGVVAGIVFEFHRLPFYEPLRRYAPPPLSGEAASKAPLKGELSPKVTEGFFVLCPLEIQPISGLKNQPFPPMYAPSKE